MSSYNEVLNQARSLPEAGRTITIDFRNVSRCALSGYP